MVKIVVILTCFNRKEKTCTCIKSIIENNNDVEIEFVIVDDKSTDNTVEAIKELIPGGHVINGNGSLFWNGGMHVGMEYALNNLKGRDAYVMINDDVDFEPHIFDDMAKACIKNDNQILVGATKSTEGTLSYGGIKYAGGKNLHFRMVGPDECDLMCDTFNANCVFIPGKIYEKTGSTDKNYTHSLGDFDYGFRARKMGYEIHVFNRFAGTCNDNPTDGTWQDNKLPIGRRLKLKEGPKGLPFKDWFRYLRKNFGLGTAIIRSITPYVKIFLGK